MRPIELYHGVYKKNEVLFPSAHKKGKIQGDFLAETNNLVLLGGFILKKKTIMHVFYNKGSVLNGYF